MIKELYDGEHGMTEGQAGYIALIENMIDLS